MRKIVKKDKAFKIIVLIIALMAILTVFPLRIWTMTNGASSGGTIISESEHINFENSIRQQFITQYDRLSSIDVYVTNVESGRYIAASILDRNAAVALQAFVDTQDLEIPGYVNIPMELNVEVGEPYYLVLSSCRSKYYVAYENIPEDTAYIGSVARNNVEVPGVHISANYNYRMPISKKLSLLIIAVIAVICVLALLAIDIYFRKKPEKNSLMTVETIIKYVFNPLAAVLFGTLAIMVFPLMIFDRRPIDIVFYELGILICAGFVFYAINHKVVSLKNSVSFWDDIDIVNRLRSILMMFSIAMSLWYACRYMNDLYDIYHTLSERLMLIWLLVLIILTFNMKETLNIYNPLWIIGSTVYGINYYNVHKLAASEKEYDLHNAALKYGIIIVILGGLVAMNLIRLLLIKIGSLTVFRHDHREKSNIRISAFGILLAVFFVMLVVLRNTRWWGVALVCTFTCFYIRYAVWKGKGDFYKILSGGFMLNFLMSLGFSWLHRYFAGYVSGRFAFIFHTVTVTAEYLTFMSAAAVVMLTIKIVTTPRKTGVRNFFRAAWKEMALFGFIIAYAIFTVSRTAIAAIAVSCLAVIIIFSIYNKKQFLRICAVLIVTVLLLFPAAFTMQRILPAIAADPVIYAIDDTDSFIRGGASWGSTNFMCVERFFGLFESKILGIEADDYEFPIDYKNYEDNGYGDPYYDIYGHPFEGSEEQERKYGMSIPTDARVLLASGSFTEAERMMLLATVNGYVDESNVLDVISNGRITIFTSYINELNMWGHDEMGALLPNGEIAVHAHNTYLQVAYDHGIFAGIVFALVNIGAMVMGVVAYSKKRKEEPLSMITFAIAAGFTVAGITEWVFMFSNPLTIALMLSLAPIVFSEKKN